MTSTKIAAEDNSETYQAKSPWSTASGLAAAVLSETNLSKPSSWSCTYVSAPAVVQADQKSVEAQRQVERLKSLSLYYDDADDCERRAESVLSAVSLLGALIPGPIPIPVASCGVEGGASLFISSENFYGDLEIIGKNVEYYIKFNCKGKGVEYFDTEEIKEGFVPPKLLSRLFHYYAQK